MFARFLGAMRTIGWPFCLPGPSMVGLLHGAGTEKTSLPGARAQPQKAKSFLPSADCQQLASLRRGLVRQNPIERKLPVGSPNWRASQFLP